MVTIEIDTNSSNAIPFFKKAPEKLNSAMAAALFQIGQTGAGMAKRLAPVDRGRLRTSIHTQQSPTGVLIATGKEIPYAKIHEFGGTIRAKRGKYLRFKSKKTGKWVSVPQVRIPKYKGRGYFKPTFDFLVMTGIKKIVTKELDRVLK